MIPNISIQLSKTKLCKQYLKLAKNSINKKNLSRMVKIKLDGGCGSEKKK